MDLLHGGTVDGFCLVSSDSDFTRLAARIREQGLMAYGFGGRKTPKPFVAACTMFVYVDLLANAKAPPKKAPTPARKKDPVLDRLLAEAVDTPAGDDGWAHLGVVGSNLSRLASDFDARSWGYPKRKDLVDAHPDFNVESRKIGEGKNSITYARRAKR
jgi:hypothetical protein